MISEATTVEEYLENLPEDRVSDVTALRKLVLENLPKGYEEALNWGMITYEVPLSIYGTTYNGKPLMYAALASQKNYMAIYLTSMYMETEESALEEFKIAYNATGKKLDMGKSCIRFKTLEDLPLELIAKQIALTHVSKFIEIYEKTRKV